MPISTLLITLVACGPKSNETTNVSTISEEQKQETYNVELDGLQVQARWDDGDTFSAYTTDGETKKKIKARMNGYNTLNPMVPSTLGELGVHELYA